MSSIIRFVITCLPGGMKARVRRYVASNVVVSEAYQDLPEGTAASIMARTDALLMIQERRINSLEMRVSELVEKLEIHEGFRKAA